MSRRDQTRLRLFVAAYPAPATARQMLASLDCIEGLEEASIRRVAADRVHLTLQFIGSVPRRELDAVATSIEAACRGIHPFELQPTHLRSLPAARSPRLIAVETDAPPQLIELRNRLVRRLAASPRERPSDRYLPHLTLCRFASDAAPTRLETPIVLPSFPVRRACLMQSRLHRGGAAHEALRIFELR